MQIAASRVVSRFRKKQQDKANTFFSFLQTHATSAFACIFGRKCVTSGDARFQRRSRGNPLSYIKNKNIKR